MATQDKPLALITGADGFIGSHLTELLVTSGYRVRALALYNSFNDWGWLETIDRQDTLEIVSGDIRDLSVCEQITQDVAIVFHLASLIAIPYSYSAPSSYIDTNVRGTLNMCQSALRNKVSRFVHVSTSEVYGTAVYVPMDEQHPLQPQSPYSASKIGADSIAMSFFYSFELPVVIARPFNTYGPRQSARAIIPTIITQILQGHTQIEVGDVSPTRDFNFVADTCRGLRALALCEAAIGQSVNIGSMTETSVAHLINTVIELTGRDVSVLFDEKRLRPMNSEVKRLFCDNRKIRALTDFTPQVSLHDGLRLTIDWFKVEQNLARYKAQLYNL